MSAESRSPLTRVELCRKVVPRRTSGTDEGTHHEHRHDRQHRIRADPLARGSRGHTIEDHQIVAAHIASAAIEHYWGGMQARPALLDFEVMVADHYSALKHEEASHTPAF